MWSDVCRRAVGASIPESARPRGELSQAVFTEDSILPAVFRESQGGKGSPWRSLIGHLARATGTSALVPRCGIPSTVQHSPWGDACGRRPRPALLPLAIKDTGRQSTAWTRISSENRQLLGRLPESHPLGLAALQTALSVPADATPRSAGGKNGSRHRGPDSDPHPPPPANTKFSFDPRLQVTMPSKPNTSHSRVGGTRPSGRLVAFAPPPPRLSLLASRR